MTLGTFLDFSKAFDTIDHKILCRKLYKYGIRGVDNDLIANKLSSRKQYVMFNNVSSKFDDITCGFLKDLSWGLSYLLFTPMICVIYLLIQCSFYLLMTAVYLCMAQMSI